MSLLTARATVEQRLADPATGWAARIAAVAAALGYADVPAALHFVEWSLEGRMTPAGEPNAMVQATGWDTDLRDPAGERESDVEVTIGYETFAVEPGTIRRTCEVAMVALAQCLDDLVEWSTANGGGLLDVFPPWRFRAGRFGGGGTPHTSNGFLCTVTVRERSTQ